MREFTKTIRRAVTVKANDPAFDDVTFVIEMNSNGITFRKAGYNKSSGKHIPWRSIIGFGLIHGGKK